MKRILFFIFFFHMLCAQSFGFEKLVDPKWEHLLDRNASYSTQGYSNMLQALKGEIISFKIGTSYGIYGNKLQCFYNLTPDTVWIKKPKKNPQINKDYYLMPYYHGVGEYDDKAYYDKDKRYTPDDVIRNASFRVDSVSNLNRDVRYVFLTNVQNNEHLIWHFSNSNSSNMTLMSQSIGEKMIEPMTTIYVNKNGSTYSPKADEFEPCQVKTAIYECEFSSYSFTPKLEIQLLRKDNTTTLFDYDKSSYDRSYYAPKYMSQGDYDNLLDEEKSYELDPVTDIKSIKYPFPFSFRQIWGETKSSGYVYQKIAGKNSYSDIKGYLDAESTVRIAGKQTIKGTEYYVATCCGKCFFIPTTNISLQKEEQLKLDSLMSCSQEVKENFLEVTKGFELYQYVQDTKELLKEFDSFKKYGLSIVEWKVYDESEYTDGTGIRFCFYNPTNSMIKYITITFTGYNAVDDPVGRAVTRKCVGPIDPDTSAEYQFEYAWFTDIVEYAKIRSIKVDYKNGTSKTITNIGAIEWSDDLYDYFQNPPLKDLTTLKTKGEPTE